MNSCLCIGVIVLLLFVNCSVYTMFKHDLNHQEILNNNFINNYYNLKVLQSRQNLIKGKEN